MSNSDGPPAYSPSDPSHLTRPPQLPPRTSSTSPAQTNNDFLRPSMDSTNFYLSNSISQASLHPPTTPATTHDRRTLLLIYIHGFMGNETSFQSFPAHLHNLLAATLDPEKHLVHTKVYPKFKTRHSIHVATAQFSTWLSRFENPTTDIILLGHSMGGLLASEVILLTSPDGSRTHPAILGQIAFDTPFLGMHPGVVTAGLASLFRSPPPPAPPSEPEVVDSFFGTRPPRNFTIAPPKKEGTWDSRLRFLSKYHGHLTQATARYLTSHLEFGACLADPVGLSTRYRAIRALEDAGTTRFANYYTVAFGRDKCGDVPEPAPPPPEHELSTQSSGASHEEPAPSEPAPSEPALLEHPPPELPPQTPALTPTDTITDPTERRAAEESNQALMETVAAATKAEAKAKAEKPKKKKRERKFCITPHGEDRTWTKVTMEGVDEVGAHCGLFFVGEVYARLVGDVADRVATWVAEDADRRFCNAMGLG